MPSLQRSTFHAVLIKPAHYDDAGYPIQWFRSAIPSNTLACLNGLALDAQRRRVLGPDVDIEIHTYDETNRRMQPDKIIRKIRSGGGKALIGLVGVQSNQFPRSIDIARPFLAAGLPVCIGGFHVSGCIAMLPQMPEEMREAQALGISFFAGEAEGGRFDKVLRDAWHGKLAPLYDCLDQPPALEGEPPPMLPHKHLRRTAGLVTSMDLGRGCPYQCSFCTIINVQGRKSRVRTPDDLERAVRENLKQNITRFFITDDNFARNRDWEPLLDRLIAMRAGERRKLGLTIQADTMSHKVPGFIEKAATAGVKRVFLGLENINPDNLIAANKRQNKITDYREMLQAWRAQGVSTFGGYILGFPGDTRESILRDIEIIKRELPLDFLELFYLTPLPGSEDHRRMLAAGEWMDPDINKYDLTHRVTHHPRMSDAEWEDTYRAAWDAFYTPEHIRTILRRAAANPKGKPKTVLGTILWFKLSHSIEGVHPLEGGVFRLKFRRDRRSGLPLENPLVFYPRYLGEIAIKAWRCLSVVRQYYAILKEVMNSPNRWLYMDTAIAPPQTADFEALDLFQATAGGKEALARRQHHEAIHSKLTAPEAAEKEREPQPAGD